MRDTERERQRHKQNEKRAPMQGVRHGTQSQVSGITPWTEGSTKPLSHPGCPIYIFLITIYFVLLTYSDINASVKHDQKVFLDSRVRKGENKHSEQSKMAFIQSVRQP